jgi:hypothetical protein
MAGCATGPNTRDFMTAVLREGTQLCGPITEPENDRCWKRHIEVTELAIARSASRPAPIVMSVPLPIPTVPIVAPPAPPSTVFFPARGGQPGVICQRYLAAVYCN